MKVFGAAEGSDLCLYELKRVRSLLVSRVKPPRVSILLEKKLVLKALEVPEGLERKFLIGQEVVWLKNMQKEVVVRKTNYEKRCAESTRGISATCVVSRATLKSHRPS